MKELEIVELADLISCADGAYQGLVDSICIYDSGTYHRSNYFFLNEEIVAGSVSSLLELTKSRNQIYPPLHQIKLENAHVIGQGFVIFGEKYLIKESCWEFLAQNIPLPGLHKSPEGQYFLDSSAAHSIEGRVCAIKRPWWRNYGHWLFDSAAWLSLLPSCSFSFDTKILIGDYSGTAMENIVSQYIEVLSPKRTFLSHKDDQLYSIDELYYVSPAQIHSHIKNPHYFSAIKLSVLRNAPTVHTPKLIYIARSETSSRNIKNIDEIESVLGKLGFKKIYFERLSLQEQAMLFNQADCVVGVKGAAFSNLIFSRAGSRAIILSPANWGDLFFWDIATIVGVTYVELFGKVINDIGGSGSDFEVSENDLLLAISMY